MDVIRYWTVYVEPIPGEPEGIKELKLSSADGWRQITTEAGLTFRKADSTFVSIFIPFGRIVRGYEHRARP